MKIGETITLNGLTFKVVQNKERNCKWCCFTTLCDPEGTGVFPELENLPCH